MASETDRIRKHPREDESVLRGHARGRCSPSGSDGSSGDQKGIRKILSEARERLSRGAWDQRDQKGIRDGIRKKNTAVCRAGLLHNDSWYRSRWSSEVTEPRITQVNHPRGSACFDPSHVLPCLATRAGSPPPGADPVGPPPPPLGSRSLDSRLAKYPTSVDTPWCTCYDEQVRKGRAMGEVKEARCQCGSIVRVPIPPRFNTQEQELSQRIADLEEQLDRAVADRGKAEQRIAELEADRDGWRNQVHYADKCRARAERERDKAREVLPFFRSVIKSGEPWTETCERKYVDAREGESDE